VNIDIEVNLLDAGLPSAMAATFVPPAIAHLRVFDLQSSRHCQLPPGDMPWLL
jgi:hypothetical protein